MPRDELTPISVEELVELQQLYNRDSPEHETVFSLLQNYINWFKIDRKLKDFAIFSLNGTWRENGTFVLQDRDQLFCFSLEDTNCSITRALDLVDWDCSWKISACPPKQWPAVQEVLKRHNVELQFQRITEVFSMGKEQALEFDLEPPAGVQLHTLSVEHAARVNSQWPNAYVGSEFFVKRLISRNLTVALFDESSNELLAWCLRFQTGAHGILQVPVEQSRKGYGTLIAKAMAKKIAKKGFNSYAYILSTNDASRALFDKLGFRKVGIFFWARNVARKLVEWDH